MAGPQESSASSGSRKSGGRAVGQFNIGSEIGKGSFAQVYLGWHKPHHLGGSPGYRSSATGHEKEQHTSLRYNGSLIANEVSVKQETKAAVAIKSVELERLNKKLRENLYSEIQILKTLRHPHIVALHDCIESTSHINLIMEYCELGDLSLFIKKRDKLATHPATHDMARKYPSAPNSGLHEVVIRHFLKQLTSALEFLRRHNYVHRDVKPQNLLLLPSRSFRDQRGRPVMQASQDSLIPIAGLTSLPMLKLADFGFARVLPSTSLADTLCGSPLYMAPEILRYERYDAKADLWSVGTVLYEMSTGRPPFRARNHVELLRKIEHAEDAIKFPREVTISSDLKSLIRGLLKRSPVERLSFENFFSHYVVTSDIPGLVEDDIPRPVRQESRDVRTISQRDPQRESHSSSPRSPRQAGNESPREGVTSRSPREVYPRSPQTGSPGEGRYPRQPPEGQRNIGNSPREIGEGLGIRRPVPHHAVSAPTQHRFPDKGTTRDKVSPPSSLLKDARRGRGLSNPPISEEERAAQDVALEREYVVVERRHVEVNALADELAANEKLGGQHDQGSQRAGPMARRYTQQGAPTSITGAIPTPSSRTALVAQGRHDRRSSYEKALSASPGSASSAISKAIQDASLRLFGFRVPPLLGTPKGPSPPLYQVFPTYPAPQTSAGLIGDGKSVHNNDEDGRAALAIEEFATRSDCVYGFAEVKYKQLVPLAPSADHGLGGLEPEQMVTEEDGLTNEAIVALSEEALVLYVKSLTLLARAMDIASLWWSKKSRGEAGTGLSAAAAQTVIQRINAVVQWVRQRFNEVLEKSEVVRLKLTDAQKQLPEDHPSHPSNHGTESIASSAGSAIKQVYLTPGISAEKLMYDRALEMSRAAAIDEVTNENLSGCEISYITAIRMLEAVLDGDEDIQLEQRKLSTGKEVERDAVKEPSGGELDSDEEAHVRKMIKMITGRLAAVRKKHQMIADANNKAQQAARRRSGDVTPRSVPSHGSS
ncbi:hypothetical protein FZEAL_6117 [Fusarium zealandicum]|uniref:non-specific serine/threonine protein kinase n=1 Tax=Fusarium zealandicum TaxID=1053134 RepID=A0A8H4XJ68_9HYPO|nr:hypothetical protein FZEAL_6117 [Fusarium zealandicum]